MATRKKASRKKTSTSKKPAANATTTALPRPGSLPPNSASLRPSGLRNSEGMSPSA